jgi:hypothetical protein
MTRITRTVTRTVPQIGKARHQVSDVAPSSCPSWARPEDAQRPTASPRKEQGRHSATLIAPPGLDPRPPQVGEDEP